MADVRFPGDTIIRRSHIPFDNIHWHAKVAIYSKRGVKSKQDTHQIRRLQQRGEGDHKKAHHLIEGVRTKPNAGGARLQIRQHIWKSSISHPGVLTITNGAMTLLLTVKRSHHNQKYKRLREKCSRM